MAHPLPDVFLSSSFSPKNKLAYPRVMFFIDGTWLWHNMMPQKQKNNIKLDLYKLPREIIKTLPYQVTLERVILSASLPKNVDVRDESLVTKRENFFNLLQKKCHYTLDLYEIDFRGRRLLKKDRDRDLDRRSREGSSIPLPKDPWEPKEKCVDIAVASNLLYHAALDDYDQAVVITGDKDFIPALSKVKQLNKEIIIASFRESCSHLLTETYKTIFIDDILDRVILE